MYRNRLELALQAALEIAKRLPPMTEYERREQAVSFALGNLNASTNHRTTREAIERAYDDLHAKGEV